jgi:hypothetical protein
VCTSSTCVVPNTHTQHAQITYMKNVLRIGAHTQQTTVPGSQVSTQYNVQFTTVQYPDKSKRKI